MSRIHVYRISLGDGRFDHVEGKRAATQHAARMLNLDELETRHFLAVSDDERRSHWGVTVKRVSETDARAVGLQP